MGMNKAVGSKGATTSAPGMEGSVGLPGGSWAPNTDVYSTPRSLVVNMELTGMKREDLRVAVEDDRLKISGHRSDATRDPRCKFLRMEINYGPFERVIEIPASYDVSQVRASYDNGFLRLEVPLAVPRVSRPVEISS